ncbi:MAG: TlpA family protein disulfide reductase [Cytophagia bacterium]|nr:MAG: TlpA family protein disulfide reductase [Runella sp.]TAG19337.1 MAG: TlpA family protein disulfide reductase [Cytophagales bacterium]TAG38601.1 MAG: TlpA family protein disulfide reductase [Cytophagia bacterium]TAG53945.1 MAG: TlpA family protein disulfide reductase [Runella slithyformis]TAG74711.1 MAG: TlpA family protein disulfide reductase [Runella slithyformis]
MFNQTTMNKSFCAMLLVIGMWIAPDCRSQSKLNTVSLTCADSLGKSTQVSIGLFSALTGSQQPIAEMTPQGTTPVTSSFPLKSPQFAFLRFGDELHTLYIRPGEQLSIHLDLTQKQTTLAFTGQGAEANSYLAETYLIQRQFEKVFFSLPLPAAFQRLDSLDKALLLFDQTYAQRSRITPNVLTLLRKQGQIRILSLKLNILLSRYGGGQDTTVVTPMVQIIKQVPFDPTLLAARSLDYFNSLYSYLKVRMMLDLSANFTKEEITANRPRLPLITDELIKKWPLTPTFTQYIRANNLIQWIGQQGITPATTDILTAYRKEYPQSVYLVELQKSYDKWLVLKVGQKAPDFTGTTLDGERISLSNLKGKVVYVDVWATWCQPCLSEFPSAKQLQQAFLPTDQVVFLYVSIDSNQADWKKLVRTDKVPSGYHINIFDQKQDDQFHKSYVISGVPRYILIDKQGNIVNPDAPKPSSKDIEKAIRVLLQ